MAEIWRIKQSYQSCLERAMSWLNQHSYPVNEKNVGIKVDPGRDDSARVTTSELLHFIDWPQRPGSTKQLDILASVEETISLESGACTKSTVGVTYFHVRGDTALAIESIHYDFALPPDKQHPICHAQNCNKSVEPRPESFKRAIENRALQDRCQTVRIPSAFVNLAGLLTILAADHLTAEHWAEFMEFCMKHFVAVPGPSPGGLPFGPIHDAGLRPWGWYGL